jgi:DNA-binding winged helix-turn-helix (wHTH) protein
MAHEGETSEPYRPAMDRPAPAGTGAGPPDRTPREPGTTSLGPQERAVLSVLIENRTRVVGRRELARHAGLADLNARRCDSVLVGLRRALGADGIVTVRSRGWMLSPGAVTRAAQLLDADASDESRA